MSAAERHAVADRPGLSYGYIPEGREEYVRWGVQARSWAASTAFNYAHRVAKADDWLREHRNVPIDDAAPADLEALLLALCRSASTRNGYHAAIRAWYRYQRVLGLRAGGDPTDHVSRARPPERIPKALDVEEARRVLAAAKEVGPGWASPMVNLLLYAMLRRDEARLLPWTALERGRWLRLLGKGNRERIVPLHPDAAAALEEWRPAAPASPFMFPRPYGRMPVSWRRVSEVVAAVGKEAGLPHLHPHVLRHTGATRMVELGVDVAALQAVMGHRTLASTMVYLRARPERSAAAVDLLDFGAAEATS